MAAESSMIAWSIARAVRLTRSLILLVCALSVALSFRVGPLPQSMPPRPTISDASFKRPSPACAGRKGSWGLQEFNILSKFLPALLSNKKARGLLALQALGMPEDGESLMQKETEAAVQFGDERYPLAMVPDSTLRQVRGILARLKLRSPFPSEQHSRGDFFEALNQRLADLEEWTDRYDMSNEQLASKQARLEVAMHAVRNVEVFEMNKEEINAVAKREPWPGVEEHAWRLAADFFGLELTVVQVVPRRDGSEWLVQEHELRPLTWEDKVVGAACVVLCGGRAWSCAPLETARTAAADADDDWMSVDWSGRQQEERERGRGEEEEGLALQDASGAAEWPPRAPPKKQKTAAELQLYDNITLVGQAQLRPGMEQPTWRLSKEVEEGYNPALAGAEERARRGDMRTKYFHLDRAFPELSEATQLQAEADWDAEIEKLLATVAKYHAKQIATETMVKRYRLHWRRRWQLPQYVKDETLGAVQAQLWEDFGVRFEGRPLDGAHGVDRLYDVAHYERLWGWQRQLHAALCVDTPEYWAARTAGRSPLLGAYRTSPFAYQKLSEMCEAVLDPEQRALLPEEELPALEAVVEAKAFLDKPVRERRLVGDLFKPEEHEVQVTLSPQQKMELHQWTRSIPPAPEGMTHVQAALREEFPDQQAVEAWYKTPPAWYDTSDIMLKYGRATRMDRREMGRFMWEMRVREKHCTLDYIDAMKRSGHRGLKLKRLLRLLPRSWEPKLLDGRPMEAECWVPPGRKPIPTRGQMLAKAFAKRAAQEGDLDVFLRARDDYDPAEEQGEEWWLQEARALGDEIEGEEGPDHGQQGGGLGGGDQGGEGGGGDGGRGTRNGGGGDEEMEEEDEEEDGAFEGAQEGELSLDYVRGAPVAASSSSSSRAVASEEAAPGSAPAAAKGEQRPSPAEPAAATTQPPAGAREEARREQGGAGAGQAEELRASVGMAPRESRGKRLGGGVWVPEWLEGEERRAAVREGRARLQREGDGWYLVYEDGEQGEEEREEAEWARAPKLEGGDYTLGEWQSVRLEKRGAAALEEGTLQSDEFFLEYDKGLEPPAAPADGEEEERVAGMTDGLTQEELAQQKALFTTIEQWMEAKRGEQVVGSVDDDIVQRVLTASDHDEALVADLRDGVFGKSVYLPPLKAWVLDDRLLPEGKGASDLEQLLTMAEAYGWWRGTEELEAELTRDTFSIFDYQSLRLSPPPAPPVADAIASRLTEEGLHFAMVGEQGLVLLATERWSAGLEVLEGLGYGAEAVVEGEYTALVAHDELPGAVWDKLCGWDYGEVQFWEVDLTLPHPPAGGSLVPEEERGAWLVPSKYADWLVDDLTDRGWRSVPQAQRGQERCSAKLAHTGELLSLRFHNAPPPAHVQDALRQGRFGEAFRLGDFMHRPTELDYAVSMLMKDAWMVPADQARSIHLWLTPDAERVEEEEREKRAEVARLKQERLAQPSPSPPPQRVRVRGADEADEPPQGRLQQGGAAEAQAGEREAVPAQAGEREAVPAQAAQAQAQAQAAPPASSPAPPPPLEQGAPAAAPGSAAAERAVRGEGGGGSGARAAGAQSSEQAPAAAGGEDAGALAAAAAAAAGGRQGGKPLFGALRYAVETLDEAWGRQLAEEFKKDYFAAIAEHLRTEVKMLGQNIYPPPNLIFSAFNLCPFDKVKVVIVGQDPYHGEGQAHGLAFSVPAGQRVPPSLRNVFQELSDDPEVPFAVPPGVGDLSPWAEQGVLLLNTILTVRAGQPLSHQDCGWELLTDTALRILAQDKSKLIFLLWGANAQKKAPLLKGNEHIVLKASHPSPLSASKGRFPFLGCRHFSKVNELLQEQGQEVIDWSLAPPPPTE